MNLASPAAVSALLRRHSFSPAQKFGQNFLVDGNTLAKIVAAGELQPGDAVLEIGTGLGVLTRALADAVGPEGRVATVERDPRLFPLHAETLPAGELPQVRRIAGDALEIDLAALPARELAGAARPERGVAVVANIPYNITTPLIARLLEEGPTPYRVIVLLMQREVAARLGARAGTPDYGAFSVFTQYHAGVEIVGSVPPTVFVPPPKITSSIVRLRPHAAPPVPAGDPRSLFAIVQAAFQQRRKTLANALAGASLGWGRERAASVLAAAGIDGSRRGETLTLAEFARIEAAARNVLGGEPVG